MATKFELKTPKGTRDFGPDEMAVREKVFSAIIEVFQKHGAVTIDTPVFELRDVLMGKYGEDSKLIYDLQDQGGELCSLRYDLTVPFARFLAMNKQYKQLKRYHIGKVYRRDQPVMTKGRMREFYQCDIDFAGQYEAPMLPDAELIVIIADVLQKLDIGDFNIKINHRKLLDGIFELCGVTPDKFRTVCSSVDKLDKTPWEEVRHELVATKGIEPAVADKIWSYVQLKGEPLTLLERVSKDDALRSSLSASVALEELAILFKYIVTVFKTPSVTFDLSLARGLDYYTGMIMETVLVAADGVGSIAGGGRYDELVSMFTGGAHRIPCVGFSFGVERIFSIMEAKLHGKSWDTATSQVLVASIGGAEMLEPRIKLCKELWDAGIRAEYVYKLQPKLLDQFEYGEKHKIPLVVVFGSDELQSGKVKLKSLSDRQDKGQLLPKEDIISIIKERLSK